jgi:hypothetical protein
MKWSIWKEPISVLINDIIVQSFSHQWIEYSNDLKKKKNKKKTDHNSKVFSFEIIIIIIINNKKHGESLAHYDVIACISSYFIVPKPNPTF